jgi:hypothetical protein
MREDLERWCYSIYRLQNCDNVALIKLSGAANDAVNNEQDGKGFERECSCGEGRIILFAALVYLSEEKVERSLHNISAKYSITKPLQGKTIAAECGCGTLSMLVMASMRCRNLA